MMRSRSTVIAAGAAIVLLAQFWMMSAMAREPVIAPPRSFDSFPPRMGQWTYTGSAPTEKEMPPIRGADAVLNRNYSSAECGCKVSLQIAYYRTQMELHQQYDFGEYLPEEGWSRISSRVIRLALAERGAVPVRYDLVARGSERRAILRWFETRQRIVADGGRLHLYRILDTMRRRRTDIARVQIVAPEEKKGAEQASQNAIAFARPVVEETTALLFRP
ncbi:MAG TPA: EpsI family protein [Bryobacteraceae bacterium]|nr:EpsI family protein [Bryobacteraceae bacterium]